MKKTLPDQEIANDLATSSVFFPRKKASAQTKSPTAPGAKNAETGGQGATTGMVPPRHHATTVASRRDVKSSSNHDTTQPGSRVAMPPTHQATRQPPAGTDELPDRLEEVRRVVKQLGKEAATFRLTSQEKRTLADLVYTYHRQGYRTSENEITRIAVNWLLLDFQEEGEGSVLARILERLHG